MLTADRARELLHYEYATGSFWWRAQRSSISTSKPAGCLDRDGYLKLQVDGKRYLGHRIAWLMHYGEWPPTEIDHINCECGDNRIENLRLSDRFSNCQNIRTARRHNKTGVLGAHRSTKSKNFYPRIVVNGKRISLGSFKTAEEASSAYIEAKRRYHDGNTL